MSAVGRVSHSKPVGCQETTLLSSAPFRYVLVGARADTSCFARSLAAAYPPLSRHSILPIKTWQGGHAWTVSSLYEELGGSFVYG